LSAQVALSAAKRKFRLGGMHGVQMVAANGIECNNMEWRMHSMRVSLRAKYRLVSRLVLWIACVLLTAAGGSVAQSPSKRSGVDRSEFGKLDDGTVIEAFTLRNSRGATAKIITYGATLVQLNVPDRNGKNADVVLGFDDLKGYTGDHPHFGGIIGRYANRIAKGRFHLDGKEYSLATNNGPNTLHGGLVGFDHKVWKSVPTPESKHASVKLSYVSPDGEEHFPGTLAVTATYVLTDDNALKIDYTATTDKPTVLNLTNHSYFNLAASGNVLNHVLKLYGDAYTPADSTLIPTGEIAPVGGTPYDFRQPTRIGARMKEVAKVKEQGGYDNNFVVNGRSGSLRLAAELSDPSSGRKMEMRTTEPGVQLYTGNWLDGKLVGKRGVRYRKYGAVCLEAQHYPDSPNHPNFPTTVLRPGETYHQQTIYKFSSVSAK
jgi:aldose 1-epimerase